jgi:tetratricopeptide (TPR) repeat protein
VFLFSADRKRSLRNTVRRERIKTQVVSARKRKADEAKARAAAIARARARERNAKLKLSNTLAARAEAQLERGEIAGATVNFRESLKANPKNAEALTGLSEALTTTGIQIAGENNNEAALTYFNEAVRFDPKNEVAFAKLGEIHDANGRNDRAIVNYEQALKIDPNFSSLYLPLGLAYAQAGKTIEAETYLTKAGAAGFDSPEARFARAVILVKQERNGEALIAFDNILRAEPQNAQAVYQKAIVYNKLNQTDKSFDAYRDAVRMDPALAGAWFDLGVIYYNREKYNDALSAYQQVVKLEPENYQAQANLASTYRQLERFAEANAAYKMAEPGNKNNPDLYSEWGYCLGKTNEWDKSVARLNTARELSPSAVDNTNTGWGYYNAARWDKEQKKDADATAKLQLGKKYLETAVQQDPQMDAAYLNLGATNNSLGDHKAAVNNLNRALSIHSDWVIALNQLGLAYRGSNDLPNALVQFQRVSTLDANNVFGLYSLGEIYHLTGNKKEANRVRDRLRKINPAMAGRLGDVFSGKINDARRTIEGKIPKVPRIPF